MGISKSKSPLWCFKDPVDTPESFELEESLFLSDLLGTLDDLLILTASLNLVTKVSVLGSGILKSVASTISKALSWILSVLVAFLNTVGVKQTWLLILNSSSCLVLEKSAELDLLVLNELSVSECCVGSEKWLIRLKLSQFLLLLKLFSCKWQHSVDGWTVLVVAVDKSSSFSGMSSNASSSSWLKPALRKIWRELSNFSKVVVKSMLA